MTSDLERGRRVKSRGGPQPFALSSDVRRWVADRGGLRGKYHAGRRRSFEQYGGFGARGSSGEPGSVASALRRRSALISATGINAPVLRAHANSAVRHGGAADGFGRFGREIRRPTPAGDLEIERDSPPLSAYLDSWSSTMGARARDRAWSHFRDGEYRQAARAFRQARTVDRDDHVSRIGEWWCHVSVGALQTASVLIREWVIRDENPFRHNLDMREAFGAGDEATDIRIRMRLVTSQADSEEDLKAIYVMVLWYLGDVEEARFVAQDLARETSVRMYMDWPNKMRRALEQRDLRGD